jgi:hypothetical protein
MNSSKKHLGQSVMMAALLVLASVGMVGVIALF